MWIISCPVSPRSRHRNTILAQSLRCGTNVLDNWQLAKCLSLNTARSMAALGTTILRFLCGTYAFLCASNINTNYVNRQNQGTNNINTQMLKLTHVLFGRVNFCPVPLAFWAQIMWRETNVLEKSLILNVKRSISALHATMSQVHSGLQAFPVLKYKIITAKQYHIHLKARRAKHWFCICGDKNRSQQQFEQWLVTNSAPLNFLNKWCLIVHRPIWTNGVKCD